MKKYYFDSAIGILEITYSKNTLLSLKLSDKLYKSDEETKFVLKIRKQLDEYFLRKRKKFDIDLNIEGTDFQKSVWNELLKIPYGKTKSYSQIAQNIGNNNAQRAVGSACNKNKIMIIIPCHRVISKQGNLSGFAYGKDIKRKLLDLETKNSII